MQNYIWIGQTWAANQADRYEKILTIFWKQMLKQAFRQGEDLQEEVVPLSNIFSNRLDNLVNTFKEKDVISQLHIGNATSIWLPGTGRNKVASNSQIQEKVLGRNRVAGHFEREKKAERRNGVTRHSNRE